MDILSMVMIAVGLAMDAFAVSVASGLGIAALRARHALMIAFFFGGFQALMPVMGWLAGLTLKEYITEYDHWAAFVILCFLGGKMVYEAALMRKTSDQCANPMNLYVLVGLSVATSIDALAVGVTFAFLKIEIITPVLVIGGITFAMSYAGVWIGKRFCNFPGSKVEVAGGLILIAIGAKILIEHLMKGI